MPGKAKKRKTKKKASRTRKGSPKPAKRATKAKRAFKPAGRATKTKRASKKAKRAPKAPRATRAPATEAAPGVPANIVRLAQRAAKKEHQEVARSRAETKGERASDEPNGAAEIWVTGVDEQETQASLTEASLPGPVVTARAHADTAVSDLTIEESEPPAEAQPAVAHVGRATAPSGEVVIDVDGLHVFYGAVEALKGVSFRVHQGETVSIIGSNGAGKTTTLKTVSGVSELLKHVRGRVTIMGQRVESWAAHKIARLGVAHSPEGRKIFPNQTVRDNLMLGAFGRKDSEVDRDIDEQYQRFPILGQRRNQAAGLMSGGEQQMLAMARALMARPKVILFDEPSMGLAPLIVKQIFEIIEQLKREGKTILLVEQMAFQALGIADRGYVLETGSITMEGSGADLLADPRVKEAYLGA